MAFAVESIYGTPPFAVHQYWTKLAPGDDGFTQLVESCPEEALMILPPCVVRQSAEWRDAVCGMVGQGVVVSAAWNEEEDVCGEGVKGRDGDG